MFKGQGQNTLEPSVLSTLYILIPAYLLWTGFASTEIINLKFAPWGAYKFSKHFLLSVVESLNVEMKYMKQRLYRNKVGCTRTDDN